MDRAAIAIIVDELSLGQGDLVEGTTWVGGDRGPELLVQRWRRGDSRAAGYFRQLRGRLAGTGWWPVAVLDGEGLLDVDENWPYETPDEVLEAARDVDAAAYFTRKLAWYDDWEGPAYRLSDELPDLGSIPTPASRLSEHGPVGPGSFHSTQVAVVPADEAWKVAAVLAFGVGNSISAAEHTAVARSWFERFGAEIFEYSGADIGFVLPRPLPDESTARQVANEHLAYGGLDLYGARYPLDKLDEVAADLMRSTEWLFWWD